MCKSILKGQNVPGTDGTYHGTDGTCPRDRRDAHQGVSRQNSLCLLVFSLRFPSYFKPYRNSLSNSIFKNIGRGTLVPFLWHTFAKVCAPGMAESSIYTTNLYHDTPPICITAILLRSIRVRGRWRHSQLQRTVQFRKMKRPEIAKTTIRKIDSLRLQPRRALNRLPEQITQESAKGAVSGKAARVINCHNFQCFTPDTGKQGE